MASSGCPLEAVEGSMLIQQLIGRHGRESQLAQRLAPESLA